MALGVGAGQRQSNKDGVSASLVIVLSFLEPSIGRCDCDCLLPPIILLAAALALSSS